MSAAGRALWGGGPRAVTAACGRLWPPPRPGRSPEPGLGLAPPLFLGDLEPVLPVGPRPEEARPWALGRPALQGGVRSDVRDTLFSISEGSREVWLGRESG